MLQGSAGQIVLRAAGQRSLQYVGRSRRFDMCGVPSNSAMCRDWVAMRMGRRRFSENVLNVDFGESWGWLGL